MSNDDLIRMAREAGIDATADTLCRHEGWAEPLIRFARLVAAAEREACAKVAEAYEPRCDSCPSGVADAIRARGNDEQSN